MPQNEWADAVIKVGNGRGFVAEADGRRVVITGAHCLPKLPPADGGACVDEKTYREILGPLDEDPAVWAECLFVDPVADLAVLGTPDHQLLFDQADAYDALVDRRALPIADVPLNWLTAPLPNGAGPLEWRGSAWLLSLKGRWFSCDVLANERALWVENLAEPICPGMSGSPIVSDGGRAIGVVCQSTNGPLGRNPFLWRQLPRWLVDDC